MSKNLPLYRWFDILYKGPLFDNIYDITPPEDVVTVDHVATHEARDRSFISLVRQYGEVLKNGLAEPREIAEYLIQLSDEADAIEAEVKFGDER